MVWTYPTPLALARYLAGEALAAVGEAALPALVAGLKDREAKVREVSVHVIAGLGLQGRPAA